MLPIIRNRIYTIDIEVKPKIEFLKDLEGGSNAQLASNLNFYPWTSEIYGIGIAWGNDFHTESKYYTNENISKVINLLSEEKIPLAAHNVLYDWTHIYYHFEKPLNFRADSGVVSQCLNNSDFIQSFGLKQTTEREFNVITQDKEIQEYLKIHHNIPASKYGANIHLCPTEMIEKYCRWDAVYCWKLIHECKHKLKSDIGPYMKLYMNEVKMTIDQFIEGIKVDREGFEQVRIEIKKEIDEVENRFLTEHQLVDYIYNVQVDKFNEAQSKLKTKKLDFNEWSQKKENQFNIDSTVQLKRLFDAQKLHWNSKSKKFKYPYVNYFPNSKSQNPESPKLGSKYLHAYGIGGEILSNRGEKITLSQHIDRALGESSLTGCIHPHLNLLGTASGRISGSGVNIIATPISDERYGKFLICEDGWSFLVKDFKSLEPTLLACLSNDPVLKYVTYEGEGKEPFIKDDILWIDDMYIMAAYSAPFMRKEIEENLDFSLWVKDSESQKKKVKKCRSLSKTIVLATNYGASPKKIQDTINENLKLIIPLKDIDLFQNSYWATLSVASQYKRNIEIEAQNKGWLVNLGGYPLTFYDRPNGRIQGTHKALNRVLQSNAAIALKLLLYFIRPRIKNLPIIPQICDWHDACFFKVKNEFIEEADQIIEKALEETNNVLNLPLKLRLDKHVGVNLYDCK